MTPRRWLGSSAVALAALLAVVVRSCVVSGGMTARGASSDVEASIARRLVTWGIPAAAHAQTNPLDAKSDGDLAAGRELFARQCVSCHGVDGQGRTEAASGMYPRPPSLRDAAAKRTDGDLFYLIRNGIRNTGMPGWQLPDRETWQLVLHVRALLPVAAESPAATRVNVEAYVGSAACRSCHTDVYDRWKTTLMANVVRDPKEHPEAAAQAFSRPDPIVDFTLGDVAFVYGTKWKQRFFKKVDGDYYPFAAQWDVTHKQWKKYVVKDDWWVKHYPGDNFTRPTGPLCDGCHSVNYDVETKAVTEWNVGCEKCHGPGGDHVKRPVSSTIVNPARLDDVRGNDTCMQCHSQGRPTDNPIGGKYYDWPVGYVVGERLRDHWKLEDHKLGETSFTHFADGTAHKNRMQGNDYVESAMYTHGVTCFTCHDSHGTQSEGLLRKPAQELCLDCHGPRSPNGPRAASLEEHSHHQAGSAGDQCVACHMPKIAQTMGDVNVRSHTFRFVSPAKTDAYDIPNACNGCHRDKTTTWAIEALERWRSPWRVDD